jgi:4-hydroxybenzoate polyprenyltransferase
LALADWQYGLLVLSTVLIAGGYVIIFWTKTDAINKPNNVIIGKNISETNAYTFIWHLRLLCVVVLFVKCDLET